MNEVIIRKAKDEDKAAVNEAHKRSIREVCSNDYSKEQTQVWSDVTYSDEIWLNSIHNEIYYVLEKEGTIEGFIHGKVHDKELGEIMGLYFTPTIIGQGLGRIVFDKVMDELEEAGIKKVIISGTKTARPFYEAMGFSLIEIKMSNIRGTMIETNEMQLIL